jgi:hypothetical protein
MNILLNTTNWMMKSVSLGEEFLKKLYPEFIILLAVSQGGE